MKNYFNSTIDAIIHRYLKEGRTGRSNFNSTIDAIILNTSFSPSMPVTAFQFYYRCNYTDWYIEEIEKEV